MKNFLYKFVLLIFILCTITFLSLSTIAEEGEEFVDMKKDRDQVEIMLVSRNDFTSIDIEKDGPNTAIIEQIGYNNEAVINQYGKANIAKIYQHGNNDYAYIYQNGKNNGAFIEQFIDQEGTKDRYKAEIIQEGSGLEASINQPGDGRDITILQNGNNSSVDTNILNSLSSVGSVKIEQRGNNMNLSVDALLGN